VRIDLEDRGASQQRRGTERIAAPLKELGANPEANGADVTSSDKVRCTTMRARIFPEKRAIQSDSTSENKATPAPSHFQSEISDSAQVSHVAPVDEVCYFVLIYLLLFILHACFRILCGHNYASKRVIKKI
jgi:hypothetical protein